MKLPNSGQNAQCENTATMDHLIPKSKGGTNRRDNFVVACRSCNTKRGSNYVNPVTNKPLFFVTTNLSLPYLPSKGFKLRNFILINYHKTPSLGFAKR